MTTQARMYRHGEVAAHIEKKMDDQKQLVLRGLGVDIWRFNINDSQRRALEDKAPGTNDMVNIAKMLHDNSLNFKSSTLEKATGSFVDTNKLGQGGFGTVYKRCSNHPNFRKLSIDAIVSAYSRAKSRAILLDYDGTVMPQTSINKTPSQEVLSILNTLCGFDKNTVFIVSGRGRESLGTWFSPCEKLGIAAEHGYLLRWSCGDEWEICGQGTDFGWMEIVEPVIKLYTEPTDGSSIETKE
ncbi:probable alpha,alpha-trehalose-phosphate synthase [UDP-forming] 7 [Telopea speciosissima]|uniref:probable alpha,alpha-trehalose-phosphate synthase [UDP-forming] 7 n=1 Tax=Telopea speciosissima TaxID=54955 RepID=UPI001CC50345|nr:probable alpha,alpha-trehalose-phosphate synthase [UDP-forming] 7 [Telopea speciosissima]